MNGQEHKNHMARFERLREILADAQRERGYRPVTNGVDGWVLYEQLVMWGAVNRQRKVLMGLDPIPFHKIQEVEAMAAGHVDYSKKFALYCAELVSDLEVRP